MFRSKSIPLFLVGAMLTSFAATGSVMAAASQTNGSEQAGETVQAEQNDPAQAALSVLHQVKSQLTEDKIDALADSEVSEAAQYAVNMLEGKDGANYDDSVAVEGDTYGVIPYLQDASGAPFGEATADDLKQILQQGDASPAGLALAHMLLADKLLTGDDVDQEVLKSGALHIDQAITLLSGTAVSNEQDE